MKAFLQSPVGVIEIEENDGYISSVRIADKIPEKEPETNPVLNKAISQLNEYFTGKRKNFDLPLKQSGTQFQQKAWDYLSSIPYGETVSYKAEAIAVSSEKACRAVGSANGKNNLAIVVPCHRVVNEGGKPGGYAYGLEVKKQLLDLEQRYKNTL
ncbi:methylated-DNA-[protein]-cysteine S-methyltransferase [Dysgonomonas hofstadii]|uniref:Methylated-DNA--protein-cysteine methyltransferase n=1 Tax=Dysgonomonas hofstadii TaxID=637886 RepID=A0A840CP75_9BACT|nr:methylated-DNA--[protein]-cysteine S-methyltransferase [Dysgonomonas hofstadii]MBB4037186.1 methylated-DNA-[protein]-cysteine S-methyltransferase [Dysgonomonas hofstadii]